MRAMPRRGLATHLLGGRRNEGFKALDAGDAAHGSVTMTRTYTRAPRFKALDAGDAAPNPGYVAQMLLDLTFQSP